MKKILSIAFALIIAGAFAQTFTGKPTYQILTKRLGDTLGIINVELFPNIAPKHVKNFDSLVNKSFYDSTAFHRVIPGFMIQGGDPNSKSGPISTWGQGQPWQPTVNAEFSTAQHVRGILSAARSNNINSATSQFFICVATASWLNGQYSVYGRVTGGMNYVDTIVLAPRDANDNPLQKIEMFITRTGSNDTIPLAPVLKLPANGSYGTATSRSLQWNKVSDGIIYTVDVATDSLFTNIFKTASVGTLAYTVTGLAIGQKYYWRVKTNNGGHFSPYSTVWTFNTSAVGINDINYNNQITVSPNPSTGKFLFSNLPEKCSIEIFDITGRKIYSTENKNTNTEIDLSENNVGIYFYRIISENIVTKNGKIILK